MATVKIVLKLNKVNKNGEAPLYLRITKDRKSKFISLGEYIHPKYWDKDGGVVKPRHPNSGWLNSFLEQKKVEARDVSLAKQKESKYVPTKSIKEAILGKSSESFFEYAERYIQSIERKNMIGTSRHARSVIEKMKEYLGRYEFTFDDLTVHFLKKYEDYLRNKENPNKQNTIFANMKVIRRIVNEAVTDELIPIEKNPFLKYKIKWQNTSKAFLNEEELTSLEKLNLEEGSKKFHHRNIYIFAAYVGGLRISDIFQLKWKNFDGEHILVTTQKTGSVISIKLPVRALQILEYYKTKESQPDYYIFPFMKNDVDYSDPRFKLKTISSLTAYTNTDLKDLAKDAGIRHKLSFHTSRHTWATRALRKGMRIEYVSKLLGHNSIRTTQVYAKIVNEELDKAMDVFNN